MARSSARVLCRANPAEPDAAAVPKLVPKGTESDVGIDIEARRCSMRFNTADGEWVRCCGQERLFRLPVRDCGQQLKLTATSFDNIDGGELTCSVTAPEELLTWRKQELEACNTDRSVSPTYRMSWDSHVLLSAVLGLFLIY